MFPPFPKRHELAEYAELHEVQIEQVKRDYVVSLLLHSLGQSKVMDRITFIGGTALHRTILNQRLSEDIDLLVADRKVTKQVIDQAFRAVLTATYGEAFSAPSLMETSKDTDYAVYGTGDIRVRVQLLNDFHYPSWPSQKVAINQRFSVFPQLKLRVLTPSSFVASKTTAWTDPIRNAPRDLFDLWALSEAGFFTPEVRELYQTFGPTRSDPIVKHFPKAPTEEDWRISLAHQGRIEITPQIARDIVVSQWERLIDKQ